MPPADQSAASAPNPPLPPGEGRRPTQPTLHTARLTLVPLTDKHLAADGLAAIGVRDFASDLGLYSDFSAGVLDGQ
jgi:hypothetical protein